MNQFPTIKETESENEEWDEKNAYDAISKTESEDSIPMNTPSGLLIRESSSDPSSSNSPFSPLLEFQKTLMTNGKNTPRDRKSPPPSVLYDHFYKFKMFEEK